MLTSKKSQSKPTRKVHLNIPQLLYWLIRAVTTVVIWGRATGKTDGPSAIFTAECMDNMPRSVIRIAAYTYEGLMKNILPGIVKGWEERYGYVEGIHYWIGKEPPAELKIPKPYRRPRGDAKHMIFWYNGSVALLSSMDRTINNGTEYEAILIEEARLCNENRVKELILAKRGNRDKFEKSPYYGAVLMVTDRPKSLDERWILNYKKEATPELITAIMKCWKMIGKLEAKAQKHLDKGEEAAAEKVDRQVQLWNSRISELRKKAFMYSEASTLENIHALGIKTIKDFVKLLDEWDYNISVLNKDMNKVSDGFYALLSNEHFYHDTDYDLWEAKKFDRKGAKKTCIVDKDCNLNAPLHIGFDVNAPITNVVTAQLKNQKIYTINHQFVKAPEHLVEMCHLWADYYEPHESKQVIFYFDHTLKRVTEQGHKPSSEVIIEILQDRGWTVTPMYIGQAPSHEDLYEEWNKCLAEHKGYLPVRFNAANSRYLRISMDNTDIKYSSRGTITKDKSSEKKDYEKQRFIVPPEEAPHAGEAMDSLMIGMHMDYAEGRSYEGGEVVIG